MRNGLKIVVLPGNYYAPYVLVGWLHCVGGDEFEMIGARCIRRFGTNQALAALAANGPARDTQLLEAAKRPEELHRLDIRRGIPCDPKAWEKHCPKPADWVDG